MRPEGVTCLHVLRSRRHRSEVTVGAGLPDPVVVSDGDIDPEHEALLADSVGLAVMVVLDYLSPAERLAFVLHDMFDLPFEEIAQLLGRSPGAARQLASRARRRVQGAEIPAPNPDLQRQRQVVDAFFAAGRAGDFVALARLLDPDVVLRADFGGGRPPTVFRGVSAVAKLAREPLGAQVRPVLVNGTVGRMVTIDGRPHSVLAFTVVDGKIVEIDATVAPERVSRIAALVSPGRSPALFWSRDDPR